MSMMPKSLFATVPGAPIGDGGDAEEIVLPETHMPPAITKHRRAGRATAILMPADAIPNNRGGTAGANLSPALGVPTAAVAPNADGGGQATSDAHIRDSPTIGATCSAIQELQVRRVFYIRRINMMDNAMRALVRRMLGWRWEMPETERKKINARAARIVAAIHTGDTLKEDDLAVGNAVRADVMTVAAARLPLVTARDAVEATMRKMAQSLPVWGSWAQDIAGFGPLGLAVVIGEAGDLTNYPTVSKLWKRLGLAVISGERQRKKSDREAALAHGYNPGRRAEIWSCVGDPLFKHQSGRTDKETGLVLREPGPYRIVYDRAKEAFLARGCSKGHAHAHGMRLATKELIKDLWRAWRAA